MTMAIISSNPTAISTDVSPFADVIDDIRESVQATKSENALRAYGSAWKTFSAFCVERGVPTLPADRQTVIAYLEWMATSNKRPDPRRGREGKFLPPAKVSTIDLHRSAIAYFHEMAAYPSPMADKQSKEYLSGLKRKLAEKRPAQTKSSPKEALALDELRKLVAALPDNLRGKRDRALLTVGYFGAFRRSELASLTVGDVDPRNGKLSITIQRSKTDQEGAGLYKSIPELQDKAICPVTAYRAWLDAAGIQSGVVFRSIDRWGHAHEGQMDGREVARILKESCKRAGIDERRFAGHSLRRGFVTAATNGGAADHDIMEQTGHKSSATLRRYKQMAGLGAQRAVFAAFGTAK